MKKYINYLRYDTNTATLIAKRNKARTKKGIMQRCESLYVKRTGEYFLHLNINGDESIKPLSMTEAYNWGQANMPPKKFNDVFSDASDSEELVSTNYMLKKSTVKKLKSAAAIRGVPQREIVQRILDAALENIYDRK